MNSIREKIGRKQFEDSVKYIFAPSEFQKIMLAYKLSKYGHKGQLRDSGERYFEHPKAVALILVEELNVGNPDIVIAALLHDIKEDSFILDWLDIESIFGRRAVMIVRAVTKEPGKDYFKNLFRGDYDVLLVKICDRLHNLRTLGTCRPEKIKKQLKETREYYGALIDALKSKLAAKQKWQADYLSGEILKECAKLEAGN